jgi:hypothetical protein
MITNQVILDELEAIAAGRREWIERANSGQIRRQPEAIERVMHRLQIIEAAKKRISEVNPAKATSP